MTSLEIARVLEDLSLRCEAEEANVAACSNALKNAAEGDMRNQLQEELGLAVARLNEARKTRKAFENQCW